MAKKQRLIFLGTLLVGLILFYFGIDTWLKQKNLQQNQPPPVVLKPVAPVKPQLEEQEKEIKPDEKIKAETTKEKSQIKKEVTSKAHPPEIKKEVKKSEKKVVETEKKVQQKVKREKEKSVKPKLRTYKFQIGAFKYKENAYKLYKKAKKLGYYAKVIKGERFYRVYVYVKAKNFRTAKRKVTRHFKDAILVRR
ncbi:MAG: hypothetical protein DSY42_03220 [Aquifex sp.]|nr:MAG: hypothetical protein DSY42_03220 [Aquifex sp.]